VYHGLPLLRENAGQSHPVLEIPAAITMGVMPEAGWYIAVLVAYLVGAIPFGLLIGLMRGVDIRQLGSGNIGATNLGRAVGRTWGLIGFFLDVAKGAIPVVVIGWLFGWLGESALSAGQVTQWLIVAMAAMAGHIFPIYLRFKGGKGVATGLGVMLGFWPMLTLPAIGALLTWVIFVGTLRYVSVASVVGACVLPGYFLVAAIVNGWSLVELWPLLVATSLMAFLVIVRHISNLRRLIEGAESRL
jgi:glycerol-3-phosphate acyltransferase PlsY